MRRERSEQQAAAEAAGLPQPQPPNMQQELRIRQALAELDELIGLSRVKATVREIQAYVSIQERRRAAGLSAEALVLHMVFRGNPGTGKTTVARILGRLLCELGVLSQGHLVEVERADLVGEYIGHTAQKTREQLRRAEGGILFIDEAYSLARGGAKDFGKEAIDTMVKAMEDMKDRLILILAGYQQEMGRFLSTNPGLRSRFPLHIDFPDFDLDQLMLIADQMLHKREYVYGPGARAELRARLDARVRAEGRNAGNARLVRNLLEHAIRRQALRLVHREDLGRADLMAIVGEDLQQ
jgi:stage V sporulation protein K